MFVQNVTGQAHQGRLLLGWTIHCDARAITVQIATDREFTQQRRMFTLPVTTSCALSIGAGIWFFRIGAWTGEVNRGVIGWSGIYGPITVTTPLAPKPPPPFTLPFKESQVVTNGIKYFTESILQYYAIIEISKSDLRASQTSYQYVLDEKKGFITAINLFDHLEYMIRISTFENNSLLLPLTNIIEMTEGKLFTKQKSLKPPVVAQYHDRAQVEAANAILKQENEGRKIKFISHAEYTRYLALRETSSEKKKKI